MTRYHSDFVIFNIINYSLATVKEITALSAV